MIDTDIQIRSAKKADITDICAAFAKEKWVTLSERGEDYWATVEKSTLIVARDFSVSDEGAFVGIARSMSDGYITTFLCELLVVKEYRGYGIGSMLLAYIRSLYPKTRMDLVSEADDFYVKLGFHTVGTGFRKRPD